MAARKKKPTAAESDALDRICRVLEPEAWEAYDSGRGRCTNDEGWKCQRSIVDGRKLIRAFPGIVDAALAVDVYREKPGKGATGQ